MLGKITDKKIIADNTLMAAFQLDQEVTFKSGQYIFLTLPKLNYPDERGPGRQFSINNDPSLKNQIIITTRLSDSGFKKTLNELPVGAEIELGPIAGAFTLPDDTQKPLVLIAGGIGITPFISMLRHIAKEKLSYRITLIYSNRNQASTAFLEEISNVKFQMSNFKLILIMTEDPAWAGEKRKVDAKFIKEYFPLGDKPTSNVSENLYFVVGPPAMVDAVQRSLFEAGVLPENIKIENFTGY